MNFKDLAKQFNVSVHTIYGLRKKGVLPPCEGGRRFARCGPEHVEALERYFERVRTFYEGVTPETTEFYLKYGQPHRKGFSNRVRGIVWEQCDGRCTYCETKLNPFKNFHIDHVVPVARGGTNDLENLVGACATCNIKKGAKEIDLQMLDRIRKAD